MEHHISGLRFNGTLFEVKSLIQEPEKFNQILAKVSGAGKSINYGPVDAHSYYVISKINEDAPFEPVAAISVLPYIQEREDCLYTKLTLIIDTFEVSRDSSLGASFLEAITSHLICANTNKPDIYVAVGNDKCAEELRASELWDVTIADTPLSCAKIVLKHISVENSFLKAQQTKGFFSLEYEFSKKPACKLSPGIIQVVETEAPNGHNYRVVFQKENQPSITVSVAVFVNVTELGSASFNICYLPKLGFVLDNEADNAVEVLADAIAEIASYYKNDYTTVTFYTLDHSLMREMQGRDWTLREDFSMVCPD